MNAGWRLRLGRQAKTQKRPFPLTLSGQNLDETPLLIHSHKQHAAGRMQEDTLHAATYSQKMEVLVLERSRPAFSSLEILWVSFYHCLSVTDLMVLPQDEMGLSQEEINRRFETVSAKISNVTAEMVDCDTRNRDKIKKKCETQRERIKELLLKLRLSRCHEEVCEELSLVEQNRQLAQHLKTLEDKMEDIMGNFR